MNEKDFATAARALPVTPRIAKNHTGRRSNMDGRTTRHAAYMISLSCRRRIERPFRWLKQTAGLSQVRVRGLAKVECAFVFARADHNLLRLPRLMAQTSLAEPRVAARLKTG